MRRFLGPKILDSLYVLGEERSLPLFEQLLVAGHTDPDIDRCEVIRALVAVRKLTGRVAPSAKFADAEHAVVQRALDDAERRFEPERDRVVPRTATLRKPPPCPGSAFRRSRSSRCGPPPGAPPARRGPPPPPRFPFPSPA